MNVGTHAARPTLGGLRTLSAGVLVGTAAICVVGILSIAGTDSLGWDFRYTYLRAAEAVLDGGSPYPDPEDETMLASGKAYVYPPQLAVVLAPVSALPEDVVVFVAFLGALAALMAAPAVLGVRDLRCYAAVLVWGSTSSALEMANITAFLALATACIWRFRAGIWSPAVALALAVATKLFLWPLVLWALATKRAGVAARALGLGTALVLASWAVIGFEGLAAYPELLRRFSDAQGVTNSYSIQALVVALGGSSLGGHVITVLVGGSLALASVSFARRGLDDERSFIAAIGAALLFTPVAWLHYYVLLAVPLAIARPRFSPLWLLPILLWVCPRDGNGDAHVVVPTMVVVAVIVPLLTRPRRELAPAPAGGR